MITDEQDAQLQALWEWVGTFDRIGKTRRQFWDAFDQQSGNLAKEAWNEGASDQLRERYTDILSLADDLGYNGPDEIMDQVME